MHVQIILGRPVCPCMCLLSATQSLMDFQYVLNVVSVKQVVDQLAHYYSYNVNTLDFKTCVNNVTLTAKTPVTTYQGRLHQTTHCGMTEITIIGTSTGSPVSEITLALQRNYDLNLNMCCFQSCHLCSVCL